MSSRVLSSGWQYAVTLQGSITAHGPFQPQNISQCLTTSTNPNSCPKLDSEAEEKLVSPLASSVWRPARCRCGCKRPPKPLFIFPKPFGHRETFGSWSHFVDNSPYLIAGEALGQCRLLGREELPLQSLQRKPGCSKSKMTKLGPSALLQPANCSSE